MQMSKKVFITFALSLALLVPGCGEATAQPETSVSAEATGMAGGSSATAEDAGSSLEEFGKTGPQEEDMPVSETAASPETDAPSSISLSDIPAYSGSPYVTVNGNVPFFSEADLTVEAFEDYSDLDSLGRCGVAYANICTEIMPSEERGSIGQIKPSGWQTVKYNGVVDGNYLYNRCHLIGFQLAGENANEKNLITGTRYLNVEGMLPFENIVADYVKETDNHVLYRVTPIFEGDNLVASGVLMEAMSVEDSGDAILFNVYCYNVQPYVTIDYETGDSSLNEDAVAEESPVQEAETAPEEAAPAASSSGSATYILNTNTKKFHYPSCSGVAQMSDANKQEFYGTRDEAIAAGYDPCGRCNP